MSRTPERDRKGFVHLHNHTEYSVLDGASKLRPMVEYVAEMGQEAVATTNHGSGADWYKFAGICRENDIKPIIGIEAYLTVEGRSRMDTDNDFVVVESGDGDGDFDPSQSDADRRKSSTKKKFYEHITLIAQNETGWRNLLHLVNESARSFKFKPRMDYDLLAEHSEGIICLTGCLGGPVLGYVARGLVDEAEQNLMRLIDIYGEENTFVEIMEHGIPMETEALPIVARLADRHGVRLVATNDAHYTRPEDAAHHAHLLSVQRDGFAFHGDGYHLRTEDEMRELRDEDWWQEAVSNSVVVADMCEDIVPERDGGLPRFPMKPETHHGDIDVTQFEDSDEGRAELLKHIIRTNVKRKGDEMTDELRERLNHEFGVVKSKGFVDYFLMVWDLLLWSRMNNILVGLGRGSVAGSAMAYYCEISWVDPLRTGLLFERFLDADRPDYPDMDLDFEQRYRGRVLAYIMRKYGRDHVASIGTFTLAAAKRTVKDVMRVFGAPANQQTPMTKLIPMDGAKPRPLNVLVNQEEGKPFLEKWASVLGDQADEALATALAIEGLTVGESIHACGTLISDRPLTDLIPLRKNTKKTKGNEDALDVTQWEAPDIEAYGLLKLDVLGLRNLDIVAQAVENIEARTGEKIDVYYGLPDPDDLDDPRVRKTYALLTSGKTAGCFQIESSGMTELFVRMRPDSFEDISAAIALYRPGPMGANMHWLYADRKNNREEIDYSIFTNDKEEQRWIETVLGDTYGTFVYQEQLMNLGTLFAGFDAKWRNKLRKATAKKKKEMLDEVGEQWFAGYDKEFFDADGTLISPVFSRETAERMWMMMQKSAEYLFNKAHSAAYGMLTYITAYLKANYTAEYGAAILAITDGGKAEKRRAAFAALRDEGIEILPPDVNRSRAATFPLDEQTVIIGLREIKGLGEAGAMVAATRHHSELTKPFTSLHNLVRRVLTEDGKAALSVSDVEKLILSGACDEIIGGYRMGATMVSRVASTADIPIPPIEYGNIERSQRQRSLLGVAVGDNPLLAVKKQLRDWRAPASTGKYDEGGAPATPLSMIPAESDLFFTTIGILSGYSERDYSGGKMANLSLEGSDTSLDGVMFNRAHARLDFTPAVGQVVAASGYTKLSDWSPAPTVEDEIPDDMDEESAAAVESEPRLELFVNSLWLVEVDDPVTGELNRADLSWSEAIELCDEDYPIDGSSDEEESVEDDDALDEQVDDDPDDPDDDDPDPDTDDESNDDDDPDDDPDDGMDAEVTEAVRLDADSDDEPDDEYDVVGFLESVVVRSYPDEEYDEPSRTGDVSRSDRSDDGYGSAPIIPITVKQVDDGRKVPIIYREHGRNDQSAYNELDPGVVARMLSMEPLLEKTSFVENRVQVERHFERNHDDDTMELRFIRVVTIKDSELDLRSLPALYDTDNGTRVPNTIADLYTDQVSTRKKRKTR